jgi:hypothetical protein
VFYNQIGDGTANLFFFFFAFAFAFALLPKPIALHFAIASRFSYLSLVYFFCFTVSTSKNGSKSFIFKYNIKVQKLAKNESKFALHGIAQAPQKVTVLHFLHRSTIPESNSRYE